ncbi:EF-hand calcium-binding domain-containing protein 5 [Fasciola hepatica]|uniref:EF-hand calcium-binding domain-containing protein 5 n=1 Tax=Fasciola hepatica TaxID=6192 RepID=A0A4E0RRI3_FASHE|nr:EF-hand calcium-binding domain-containing protein 5 [Fasciola hepatica]
MPFRTVVMYTFREPGTIPFKRPCCFQHQISELSTYTDTQDLSLALRTSSEYNKTDSEMQTNITSPGDVFVRRSLAVMLDNSIANKEADKIRIGKLVRQVSLDVLATEWLNLDQRTIENRAYLIDSVLPQVVLGLEHILREAVKKQLVGPNTKLEAIQSKGADPNFNPINRLAEFLMRNNHKYNNFCETSPYVRGLRNTVAKLKDEMFMRCDSQLAKLKAAVMKTREERIRRRKEDEEEGNYREARVNDLFEKFLSSGKQSVETSTVHDVIYAFLNLSVKLPESIRQILVPIFEKSTVEDCPETYGRNEFVTYVMLYAKPLNKDIFEIFIDHMELCASEYRNAVEKEKKKHLMTKFFLSCDLDQSGGISRDRLRVLCERYFESAPKDMRELLRNPADWPVREYHLRVISPTPEPLNDGNISNAADDMAKSGLGLTPDQNNSAALVLDEVKHSEANVESQSSSTSEKTYTQCIDQPESDLNAMIADNRSTENLAIDETLKAAEPITKDDHLMVDTELHAVQINEKQEAIPDPFPLDKQIIISKLSALAKSVGHSAYSWSERQVHHGYQFERLTLPQFLQFMNQFIIDVAPLAVVSQVVQYFGREFHKIRCTEQTVKSEMYQVISVTNNNEYSFLPIKANEELVKKIRLARAHSFVRHEKPNTGQPRNTFSKTSHDLGETNSSVPGRIRFGFPEFRSLLVSTFQTKDVENCGLISEEILLDLTKLITSVTSCSGSDLEEQLRTNTRRKWLKDIDRTVEKSTISMQLVYTSVFEALLKDNLQFGNRKEVSAHFSVLQSSTNPKENVLNCVAAVPESEARHIVGLQLHPYQTSLSFRVIRTGEPIRLNQLTKENVDDAHFWDKEKAKTIRTEIRQSNNPRFASCLVLPVTNALTKIIGVLGVDTLTASNTQPGFADHELEFYQGVATRLGRAYSLISSRRLFAQTVQSGFEWLSYRVQHLDRLVFYQCQDYQSGADAIKESDVGAQVRQCILQQVVTKHQFQPAVLHQTNVGIKRTGNQCMEYLFNVADTSEPCDINWLGTRHMIYPLRDSENVAFGLVDLYVRSDNAHEKTSQWLAQLTEHLNTMLGILNLTYGQLVIRTGLETMDRLVLGEMELNKSNQQDADYISGVENQIPFETAFEYFIAGELHKIRCLISDEASF